MTKVIILLLISVFICSSLCDVGYLMPNALLKLPFSAPGAKFGSAVAINALATTVAIGAPKYNGTGIVDTFMRKNYMWYHDTLFLPPFSSSSVATGVQPLFGNSIAIYSSMNSTSYFQLLAIGAPGLGVVYIYAQTTMSTTGSSTWNLIQNITNPSSSLDWGRRVSFSTLLPLLIIGGDQSAQIYSCSSSMCSLYTILQKPDISLPVFAERALISANYAIIGSYQAANDSGMVFIYRIPQSATDSISSFQTLTSTIPGPNEFGKAVAFKGTNLVIGAPYEATTGTVYWYTINSTSSNFQLLKKLTPPANWKNADYGISLALDYDEVLVGADSGGEGRVFEYHFPTNPWTDAMPDTIPLSPSDTNSMNTGFGNTLASGGPGAFVIGFPGESTGAVGVNINPVTPDSVTPSNLSGAAYIVSHECGLTSHNTDSSPAWYGVPLSECVIPPLSTTSIDINITENLVIPPFAVLTISPGVNRATIYGDLKFNNNTLPSNINNNNNTMLGGTLEIIAGTVLTVTGSTFLNNSRLHVDTTGSVYIPKEKRLEFPFLHFVPENWDKQMFGNITLSTSPPSTDCQFYTIDQSLNEDGNGINLGITLDESLCNTLAAEETSLVGAVLFVIIGVPALIAIAAVSQYHLGMLAGETE